MADDYPAYTIILKYALIGIICLVVAIVAGMYQFVASIARHFLAFTVGIRYLQPAPLPGGQRGPDIVRNRSYAYLAVVVVIWLAVAGVLAELDLSSGASESYCVTQAYRMSCIACLCTCGMLLLPAVLALLCIPFCCCVLCRTRPDPGQHGVQTSTAHPRDRPTAALQMAQQRPPVLCAGGFVALLVMVGSIVSALTWLIMSLLARSECTSGDTSGDTPSDKHILQTVLFLSRSTVPAALCLLFFVYGFFTTPTPQNIYAQLHATSTAQDPLLGGHQAPQSLQSTPTGKPVCKFGKGCYRQNPQHFLEYAHP